MYSRTLPIDTPSPIFSRGRGCLYTGYLERIIPSSKVKRIVHSKLKLFHFKLRRITYLTRIVKRITRLTRIILNECRAPALSWAFACLFLLFHKDYFKLTIDISMFKIILEVEYCVKSMIYQMLNFIKRIAYFIPR